MLRLFARLILLTQLVDRGYRSFDRLRSALVLAFASDAFLDAYNTLAYGTSRSFNPAAAGFRQGLFEWERAVIERHFPAAPARVLVGGAGGGREAFALLDRGYEVVAFDPAEHLVREMGHRAKTRLLPLIGRYGDLPRLRALDRREMDLALAAPFDAGIMGWASFSHLRSDQERAAALRAFAAVTNGPVLMSYFSDPVKEEPVVSATGLKGWVKRRVGRRGRSMFSAHLGYYRLLRHEAVLALVQEAGLRIVEDAPDENFPYVVVSRMTS